MEEWVTIIPIPISMGAELGIEFELAGKRSSVLRT